MRGKLKREVQQARELGRAAAELSLRALELSRLVAQFARDRRETEELSNVHMARGVAGSLRGSRS